MQTNINQYLLVSLVAFLIAVMHTRVRLIQGRALGWDKDTEIPHKVGSLGEHRDKDKRLIQARDVQQDKDIQMPTRLYPGQ